MQEMEGQKRERVDSCDSSFDSLHSKRVRLDSYIMTQDSSVLDHRVKDDPNSEDILREDFLDILEEEQEDAQPQIQGLESVIRSLEDEINPPDLMVLNEPDQIELGYLLEASDDELGLPPADSIGEGARSEIGLSPISSQTGVLGSENDDSFAHRIADGESLAGNVLTIDGLFEYGGRIEASDLPELEWRPESMPAL